MGRVLETIKKWLFVDELEPPTDTMPAILNRLSDISARVAVTRKLVLRASSMDDAQRVVVADALVCIQDDVKMAQVAVIQFYSWQMCCRDLRWPSIF